MCGLVGVFGPPCPSNAAVFNDLLQIDVLRGLDSTGVCVARHVPMKEGRDTHWVILKDVCLPQELMRTNAYKNQVDGHQPQDTNFLYMGHNRWATRGQVIKANAHPFRDGHIICAHNGTLDVLKPLLDGLDLGKDNPYETDSQLITRAIKDKGIDWTWERLGGAAALSIWDDEDEMLHLITNGKRPLHHCWSADGKTLYWASEAWMLRGILARNHVPIKEDKVWAMSEHFLFSFTYRGKKKGVHEETEKLEPFNMAKYWAEMYPDWEDLIKGGRRHNALIGLDDDLDDDVPLLGNTPKLGMIFPTTHDLTDLYAKNMTVAQFDEQYIVCAFCNNAPEYEDSVILDSSNAVCGSCTTLCQELNIDITQGV